MNPWYERGAGDEDAYRAVRGQIEHESTLVGVRLGWLIAAEAFLVAGYATVLTVPTSSSTTAATTRGPTTPADFASMSHTLFTALPIAGITLAAVMGVSIWAALLSMGRLRDEYNKGHEPTGFPPIGASLTLWRTGAFAPFIVPLLTVAGWVYVLWVRRHGGV